MKKIATIVLMLTVCAVYSQDKNIKYEQKGDLVEVTYMYDNGQIEQHGFFKDKKLHGTWKYYNEAGEEIAIGTYKLGKKEGKWIFRDKDTAKEVDYENGKVMNVNLIANTRT
ncbi:MAG: nicotinic acid mononucleotide adenyltransferase, partial [Bacteroidia bacterium]|nr:nicotinic acid mononucleotide adenyltransferase [Bacteroidia bacterium]